MEILNLAENLIRLRREKGITQEELAQFVGVTKASISKWETRQTYPDILILPKLASYFDVSVDELLGYNPQLSKQQIKAYYHRMAADFAEKPFEDVMGQSEELVKKYYSCYPFVLQICILWLNHWMLAESEARGREIQQKIIILCEHIMKECQDINICNDALGVWALIKLQTGNAEEVIQVLEERADPKHMNRLGTLLVQAYLMSGEVEQAESVLQAELYQNIQETVSGCITLMKIHGQNQERFLQILKRADKMVELFDLERLNPNTAAAYQFSAAILFCGFQKEDEVYERLELFMRAMKQLLKEPILHGDLFFDCLDQWFESLDLGAEGVRNKKLVLESGLNMLNHPAFKSLKNQKQIERCKQELEGMRDVENTKSDKNI